MWNKKTTKMAALVALIAIFGSVIWTGVLVIFETLSSSKQEQKTLSQEQINTLLKSYSGTLNNSWMINTNTWISTETLTWTIK